MTSSYLNYLFKGPISRCSHILRCPAHKDRSRNMSLPTPVPTLPLHCTPSRPRMAPGLQTWQQPPCGLSRLPCFFHSRGAPLLLLARPASPRARAPVELPGGPPKAVTLHRRRLPSFLRVPDGQRLLCGVGTFRTIDQVRTQETRPPLLSERQEASCGLAARLPAPAVPATSGRWHTPGGGQWVTAPGWPPRRSLC